MTVSAHASVRRHAPPLRAWARHLLWPAAVLASGVHLLSSLHVPFELPAAMLALRVAHGYDPGGQRSSDLRASLALVEIDKATFDSRYDGRSPLNRCRLAKDLASILANEKLQTVAIDLFLSPGPSKADESCQQKLEAELRKHAGGRIVAILEDTFEDQAWARGFPNITFASAKLRTQFGIVRTHRVGGARPGLGSVVAARLCKSDGLPRPDFCADVVGDGNFADDRSPSHEIHPIRFDELRQLHKGGEPVGIADPCVVGPADCSVRHVLIGAGYSKDDLHLTPVGRVSGVGIHAAIAARPRAPPWHLTGYLLDIALGALVFGPLVSSQWHRFFEQRTGRTGHLGGWHGRPELAYLRLVFLALACVVLVIALVIASAYLYAWKGVWISPAPIALGMAFEGLVSGSVHGALAVLPAAAEDEAEAGGPSLGSTSRWQHFLIGAPTGLGVFLVLVASLHALGWSP